MQHALFQKQIKTLSSDFRWAWSNQCGLEEEKCPARQEQRPGSVISQSQEFHLVYGANPPSHPGLWDHTSNESEGRCPT